MESFNDILYIKLFAILFALEHLSNTASRGMSCALTWSCVHIKNVDACQTPCIRLESDTWVKLKCPEGFIILLLGLASVRNV